MGASLNMKPQVRPEILCVGYRKKIVLETFIKTSEGFTKIGQSDAHPLAKQTGKNFLVHSAGTCNGDSGGPVFLKDKMTGRYVVLGVVSGGRGRLGNCGGINNPTHYGRAKFYVPWIKQVLGKESSQLCIATNE